MYDTLVIIYRENYHYRDNFAMHYQDIARFFHYRAALVLTYIIFKIKSVDKWLIKRACRYHHDLHKFTHIIFA